MTENIKLNIIFTLTPIILVMFTIAALLGTLALLMGKHPLKDRETLSPFECGFDPYKKSRTPFSLRFFLVTLIFLIFDIEIALLLPLGAILTCPSPEIIVFTALILMVILVLGLLHEWRLGALNWT
uniref:NADH-ubiquinone oxidoreductase chain 3 n=1 Tax=Stygobromus indentatus TaxID=1678292 RepID=A0A172QHB9_9CRUS|nr:NADH dehydrogenase subunit 3 [Stygobromus indentatus]AND97085.1 NADH dehydrogenase subunit 3 [Stygobromus indentatus]